ncbi:MAG: ribosome biogenesis GTP-binding protein YihA/YsxC [Bacteroidota bacterium]
MNVKQARFIISNSDYKKCPPADKPEFAFIGRSNVGKSSLINMLVGKKSLAKISSKPGKTQLINHFLINEAWYLVDLPGYGWAKVSKTEKAKWEVMIRDYLTKRENLTSLFVLIDSRLDPQQIDLEFINWAGQNTIPFALIFTKSDKLSKTKIQSNVAKFKKRLLKDWEELPPMFVTSSMNGDGRQPVLDYISDVCMLDD